MPAPIVTVRSAGFKEKISSMGFKERNWLVLSAILLKQWRVPSTFNLACFLTKFFTCSMELAAYRLSVLYSKLPAQFLSLVSGNAAKSREAAGAATVAESSLMKFRLFTG